jgi:hypothetical protein
VDTDFLSDLADDSPVTQLPADALSQTVSWSSVDDRPVSLGEFIAAWAPPELAALVPVDRESQVRRVKHAYELDEAELEKTVLARLQESEPNIALGVVGEGGCRRDDLLKEVEEYSPLGKELMEATRDDIEYLEILAESGKLQFGADKGEKIRHFIPHIQRWIHEVQEWVAARRHLPPGEIAADHR